MDHLLRCAWKSRVFYVSENLIYLENSIADGAMYWKTKVKCFENNCHLCKSHVKFAQSFKNILERMISFAAKLHADCLLTLHVVKLCNYFRILSDFVAKKLTAFQSIMQQTVHFYHFSFFFNLILSIPVNFGMQCIFAEYYRARCEIRFSSFLSFRTYFFVNLFTICCEKTLYVKNIRNSSAQLKSLDIILKTMLTNCFEHLS